MHDTDSATNLPKVCLLRAPANTVPAITQARPQLCGVVAAQQPEPFPPLSKKNMAEARQCLERMEDRTFHVRYAAAMRLVGFGPGVIPLLLPVLRDGRDLGQLDAALDVLKQLGDPRALPEVASLLDSTSERIRHAALRALRWLADDPVVFTPALADPWWRIRREAVFALVELRRENTGALLEPLLRDIQPMVRAAAANALGILGQSRHVRALVELLDDPAANVREIALWSLKRIEGCAIRDCIQEMLCRPVNPRNVVLAARALSVAPSQTAVRAVISAAEHAGSRQKVEVVKSIAPYGNPEHLPFLESLLRNESEAVRKAAAWGIGVHTLRCATRRARN